MAAGLAHLVVSALIWTTHKSPEGGGGLRLATVRRAVRAAPHPKGKGYSKTTGRMGVSVESPDYV